ncbi:hypothetical protein K470DRAFT_264481 [Piedraia hortae CBS 480.64]|uniref:Uncharacterized protein n=1 Tax=Piedraia hortae CBS 480.64 TaxID=1314780 RepID=A0A6A7BZ32_9PEZI|nr:hypothetical protein K470DRAFT_264481 [Piedraia hortae CBS 480.64]
MQFNPTKKIKSAWRYTNAHFSRTSKSAMAVDKGDSALENLTVQSGRLSLISEDTPTPPSPVLRRRRKFVLERSKVRVVSHGDAAAPKKPELGCMAVIYCPHCTPQFEGHASDIDVHRDGSEVVMALQARETHNVNGQRKESNILADEGCEVVHDPPMVEGRMWLAREQAKSMHPARRNAEQVYHGLNVTPVPEGSKSAPTPQTNTQAKTPPPIHPSENLLTIPKITGEEVRCLHAIWKQQAELSTGGHLLEPLWEVDDDDENVEDYDPPSRKRHSGCHFSGTVLDVLEEEIEEEVRQFEYDYELNGEMHLYAEGKDCDDQASGEITEDDRIIALSVARAGAPTPYCSAGSDEEY